MESNLFAIFPGNVATTRTVTHCDLLKKYPLNITKFVRYPKVSPIINWYDIQPVKITGK